MAITRPTHIVKTEETLIAKLAIAGPRTVKLGTSIVITRPIVIPRNVILDPDNHKYFLINGGNGAIIFQGELNASRQQVFVNFKAGEIKGTFNGRAKFPEWWGLQEGYDDIAINTAIQSSPKLTDNLGHVVSLGSKNYYISSPLELSGNYTSLIGPPGGGKAKLFTTKNFTAKWLNANQWPHQVDGNHAAVIWMGSENQGDSSFHSVVEGIVIDCYQASISNPTKRISGISSKCWVEECSRIRDVAVFYASGCGIGFPQHSGKIATLNGVIIESVWVAGPMLRDSVPVLFTSHSNNTVLRNFTIDSRLPKEASAGYDTPSPGTYYDKIYPKPEFIRTWPQIGIKAMGNITIERGHMEGPQTAIWVAQGVGNNTVRIQGIDTYHLTDSNQIWSFDERDIKVLPPNDADQWKHSTAVLLSSTDWDVTRNLKDTVIIDGVRSVGNTSFLLRDRAAGINVISHGQNQSKINGVLRHYSRRDMMTPDGSWYNPLAPATDRAYYRLEV